MRPSLRRLVLVGGLAAMSATAAADDRGETSRARADLQPSNEVFGAQAAIRNQTYDLVGSSAPGEQEALLIHRQQDLEKQLHMDGFSKKQLKVEVFKVDGVKKAKLFQFEEKASASTIEEGLGILVASDYGCCDSTDVHAVRSLENGKRLFFAGGDHHPYIFGAFWLNTPRARLVGVHVSGSPRDAEVYQGVPKETSRHSMMVSLASPGELLDQIVFVCDGFASSPDVTSVEWVPGAEMKVRDRILDVWPPKDKQHPPIPRIRITLANEQTISIPLDGDRFGEISIPEHVTAIRRPVKEGR